MEYEIEKNFVVCRLVKTPTVEFKLLNTNRYLPRKRNRVRQGSCGARVFDRWLSLISGHDVLKTMKWELKSKGKQRISTLPNFLSYQQKVCGASFNDVRGKMILAIRPGGR